VSRSVARQNGAVPPTRSDLEPLPARSVALSLLLGTHPARLSPAQLTRMGEHFGVAAPTMRVALTRAVAAGDLRRVDGDYALGERLVRRQRRQDEAVEDAETPWDGTWEMAVVVVTGRSGSQRAALRDTLAAHRLAELREGVWTRPANLRRARRYAGDPVLATYRARPDGDPVALAAGLWDLGARAAEGARLLELLDPLLPTDLLPADWPGPALRAAYADYQAELGALATT
jgi:phenylacetic acid degradation operon negative regulatory protein